MTDPMLSDKIMQTDAEVQNKATQAPEGPQYYSLDSEPASSPSPPQGR